MKKSKMNMRPILYLVGLLLSSVGLVLLAQKDTVERANNEMKCNMYSMDCAAKGKNCCGIWNNGVCIKGDMSDDGMMCRENKWLGAGILVMFVLWIAFLILFLVSLFSCYSGEKKRGRKSRR